MLRGGGGGGGEGGGVHIEKVESTHYLMFF